jgi:hypothetical protein
VPPWELVCEVKRLIGQVRGERKGVGLQMSSTTNHSRNNDPFSWQVRDLEPGLIELFVDGSVHGRLRR